MAQGVWNLYFIAVADQAKGGGAGAALLHFTEQAARAQNARLLIVETSGLPQFERARAFYAKHGFEEEARVREFYKPGDDKIIYRKAL